MMSEFQSQRSGGVPAQWVNLPGGVPARGCTWPEGSVPVRGCTCPGGPAQVLPPWIEFLTHATENITSLRAVMCLKFYKIHEINYRFMTFLVWKYALDIEKIVNFVLIAKSSKAKKSPHTSR